MKRRDCSTPACGVAPRMSPVWRTRLRYAVATKQLAIVRKALTHLPAEESAPAQIHKLAVWLANQRGDVESERRALERLIAADPTDLSALDRLAELLVEAGQPERATELRRRKTRDRAAPGSISEALRAEPTDEGLRRRWPNWQHSSARSSRPERS